jgi:hypothetical protein
VFFFVRNDPTRIYHAHAASAPLGLAIEAIARDARLVAHDGPAGTDETVEKCGLAYVGASHDRYRRRMLGRRRFFREWLRSDGHTTILT